MGASPLRGRGAQSSSSSSSSSRSRPLFVGLVSLGAYNQRRLLPSLRRVADGDDSPERAAALLRRSVAWEIGLALVVLGLASVLVVTEPAAGA
jgi:putative copper export protein